MYSSQFNESHDDNFYHEVFLLRESINNCEEEEGQLEFLCKIRSLIGERRVPNFRKIFRHKEIDCLLLDSMNYWKGLQYDTLKLFIKFVAKIGYKDKPEFDQNGKLMSCRTTAVHLAAKHNYDHHLIDILFQIFNRFDANYTDESGFTHFHAACQSGCEDVVMKFLKFGQDPNCIWRETGDTPLHLALAYGRKKIVEMLLKRDANPFVTNKVGLTPLHIICRNFSNAHDLAKMLFELSNVKYDPVQVDAQDNLGRTPLHYALSRNHKIQNTVRLLLENGANPNLADEEGLTPLHYICKRRYNFNDKCDDLKIFFKISEDQNQTVEVNVQDILGNTPLHLALGCEIISSKNVVELLLRRGAEPNVANAQGSTPLHLICDKLSVYDSNEDLAVLFFKINDERLQTVEVNAVDNSGRTPLQIAVANVLPDAVQAILNHDAYLANFLFTTEPFGTRKDMSVEMKLKVISGVLVIMEHLENGGYEITRSHALKIMNIFHDYGFLKNLTNLKEYWNDENQFAIEMKEIMINSKLSLYDLNQLRFEEVKKLLTYTDCYKFMRTGKISELPEEPKNACVLHLCEKLSRRFFQCWALESFMELTRCRLPFECCELIIDESFTNENLRNICLATIKAKSS